MKIKIKELPQKIENITRKRIKQYFKDEYHEIRYERKKKLLHSLAFITAGLMCFFGIKILSLYETENIFIKTFYELLTFFSWFATWHGIDTIFERKTRRELFHNKRISESKIQFKYIKNFKSISAV